MNRREDDDYRIVVQRIDELMQVKDNHLKAGDYELAAKTRNIIDGLRDKKCALEIATNQPEPLPEIQPLIDEEKWQWKILNEPSLKMDELLNSMERMRKEKKSCLERAEDLYDALRKIIDATDPDASVVPGGDSYTLDRVGRVGQALEKLSGDLSNDNVAAAKQILKDILK